MKKSIQSLSKSNIMNGTSETEFSPNKNMTRAEFAAVALRMTAKQEEEGNGDFADVAKNKWYCGVAGASKKYGIINGFEDNTFRGDDIITKEQMVALASRILKQEDEEIETDNVLDSLNELKDADQISEWRKKRLFWRIKKV